MVRRTSQAWRATARSLVLYCPKQEWRYAIYNDEGIVDGVLLDTPQGTAPEDAQIRLLRQVEDWTGSRYDAMWRLDKPQWWSADLTVKP